MKEKDIKFSKDTKESKDNKEISNKIEFSGRKKSVNESELNYDSYDKDIEKKINNFAEKIIEDSALNIKEDKSTDFLLSNFNYDFLKSSILSDVMKCGNIEENISIKENSVNSLLNNLDELLEKGNKSTNYNEEIIKELEALIFEKNCFEFNNSDQVTKLELTVNYIKLIFLSQIKLLTDTKYEISELETNNNEDRLIQKLEEAYNIERSKITNVVSNVPTEYSQIFLFGIFEDNLKNLITRISALYNQTNPDSNLEISYKESKIRSFELFIPALNMIISSIIKFELENKVKSNLISKVINIMISNLKKYKVEFASCLLNVYFEYLIYTDTAKNLDDEITFFINYVPEISFNICLSNLFSRIIPGNGMSLICLGSAIQTLLTPKNKTYTLLYNSEKCYENFPREAQALVWYNYIKERNMLKDEVICNIIINYYSKKYDLEKISEVLKDMEFYCIKPTIITYNTIIDAYIRKCEISIAFELFDKIKSTNLKPDSYTYCTLVKGFKYINDEKDFYKAKLLTEEVYKNKEFYVNDSYMINILISIIPQTNQEKHIISIWNSIVTGEYDYIPLDIVSFNTIIKCFAYFGNFNESFGVYEFLEQKMERMIEKASDNENSNNITKPNKITLNSMINLCSENSDKMETDKVWNFVLKMKELNIECDNYTFCSLVKSLIFTDKIKNNKEDSKYSIIFEIYEKLKNSDSLDEIVFNCLLDFCIKKSFFDRFYSILDDLKKSKIQKSVVTYGIIIKGLGILHKYEEAFNIFDKEMVEMGIEPTVITYGSIINLALNGNYTNKAIEYFKDLERKKIPLNTILCTTLIKAYGKRGEIDQALKLYESMKTKKNCLPSRITDNTIIELLIRAKKLNKAEIIFNSLGSNLDIVVINTMLRGYIDNYKLKEAIKLFLDCFKLVNQYPDESMFNCLMSGLMRYKQVELALKTYFDVKNMYSNNLKMNYIGHSILMKVFGISKRYDLSKSLFDECCTNKTVSIALCTCFAISCFKSNHIKEIENIKNAIYYTRIKKDSGFLKVLIDGYMEKNMYENTLDEIDDCIDSNIFLDKTAYVSIFSRCIESNKVIKGMVFKLIKKLAVKGIYIDSIVGLDINENFLRIQIEKLENVKNKLKKEEDLFDNFSNVKLKDSTSKYPYNNINLAEFKSNDKDKTLKINTSDKIKLNSDSKSIQIKNSLGDLSDKNSKICKKEFDQRKVLSEKFLLDSFSNQINSKNKSVKKSLDKTDYNLEELKFQINLNGKFEETECLKEINENDENVDSTNLIFNEFDNILHNNIINKNNKNQTINQSLNTIKNDKFVIQRKFGTDLVNKNNLK